MQNFTRRVHNFFHREEGATMVEYGLMVAMIALVCILVVTALGLGVDSLFRRGDDAILSALS